MSNDLTKTLSCYIHGMYYITRVLLKTTAIKLKKKTFIHICYRRLANREQSIFNCTYSFVTLYNIKESENNKHDRKTVNYNFKLLESFYTFDYKLKYVSYKM